MGIEGETTTRSLRWDGDAVIAVDQCALPHDCRLLRLRTVDEVIDAITRLAVRGAPAIGVAGAFAVALSAIVHTDGDTFDEIAVRSDAARIATARPTAVNLNWVGPKLYSPRRWPCWTKTNSATGPRPGRPPTWSVSCAAGAR
jgi:methylthioribose-1-phosphate isomerase